MPKQMEYFREYKSRVELQIGKERTEVLVKNAIYVISAGTNDFAFNYFGVSKVRRYSYSIPRYYQFLVQQIQQFIQVSSWNLLPNIYKHISSYIYLSKLFTA